MKYLLPILVAISFSFSFKGKELSLQASYTLDKSERDTSLAQSEAVFKFSFKNFDDTNLHRIIDYTIDGVQHRAELIENTYFEIKTLPGKHIFVFDYLPESKMRATDSLEIKSGYRDEYSIYFPEVYKIDGKIIQVVTCKPVIYLYPETEIDVQVNLNIIDGKDHFYYPEYNKGWDFSAKPNGDLTIGESTYNYLFWEATQNSQLKSDEMNSGFVVQKDQTIAFLEDKLTKAGLSSKEQADFITFWGPRLMKNENNFVRFKFNETCDDFAELNITPKPDNVYRIYILFMPVDSNYTVIEQEIVPMNREGFTVVEWGGQEHTQQLVSSIF